MKNRIVRLIAMGILSLSLISNQLVVFAAEDKVIEYHEEITDIETESEANEIAEEKTEEQEEMKQDIIDQGGTYDYTVTVETITIEKEVTEEIDSAAEAASLADETGGTIETEVINSTEGSTTVTVETEDDVEAAVDEVIAAAPDNIEREVTKVETKEVSGVSAEQVDEKGYHIEENEDGSFTIVITGGLDEIEIDFAWFSATQLMYPGDVIDASFTIVNESGDKYEVTGYEKTTEGPYRYVLASRYKEEYGEKITEFTSGGRTYIAYNPNDLLKVNGSAIDRSTLEMVIKMWPDKTMKERRELAKNLTQEDLLKYYNEQMGTDYEIPYEAWAANLNERLWTTTYTKNGEEEEYGEDFWKSIDLTSDTPIDFTMTASLDGLGTDNVYQMTVWDFIEILKIKAIPNIEVTVDYVDKELKYIVTYTVEETTYAVEIDGKGSIPKRVDPPKDPDPDPKDPEEPTPTEIIDTPVPLSGQVLGETRAPEKQVLGARRAATGDNDIMKRYVFIIGCICLIALIIATDISRKKKP